MYSRILIPLEHSASDASILEHVRPLARMCGSTLVFIHVADGWAARNISQLQLRESDEMRDDRGYLERVAAEMAAEGFQTEAILATGEPGTEIKLTSKHRDRRAGTVGAMQPDARSGVHVVRWRAAARWPRAIARCCVVAASRHLSTVSRRLFDG